MTSATTEAKLKEKMAEEKRIRFQSWMKRLLTYEKETAKKS
jgi:hypothetical protein